MVLLAGALVVPIASCGFSRRSGSAESTPDLDSESIENSGRPLSGDFLLSQIEDAYRPKSNPTSVQTSFSFDESGSFKRQDKSRIEEGVYLISTQGELVIYIEKINGELLPAARVDRYTIIEESPDSITLGSGPSRKIVLKKR
jgi:hypothetical protein